MKKKEGSRIGCLFLSSVKKRLPFLFVLVAEAFGVDFLGDVLYEGGVEAEGGAVGYLGVEHLLPTFGLEEGHVVAVLDVADGG